MFEAEDRDQIADSLCVRCDQGRHQMFARPRLMSGNSQWTSSRFQMVVLRSLCRRCLAEATVRKIGKGTRSHHSLYRCHLCLCQILNHWLFSIRDPLQFNHHIKPTATCLDLHTITTKGQWEETRVWGYFMFQIFPPAPPLLVPVWDSRVNPRI